MPQPFNRKRLWTHVPFQARLLLRMACYLLVFVALAWHGAFFSQLAARVGEPSGESARLGGLYLDFLRGQGHFLLAVLVLLPAAFYDLLKFSHRIAGPLYRCQRAMRQMAAGQAVAEFKPRKGDHMPEFFDAFNALVRAWNARLAAERGGTTGCDVAEPAVAGGAKATPDGA
jgi:hypothetical protein